MRECRGEGEGYEGMWGVKNVKGMKSRRCGGEMDVKGMKMRGCGAERK